VHKTANVLNKLPKSQHSKAKRALLCAAVTNWAMERRRGAGAGGVKTVQWLG
jgi:hypothetical protein